ncbi:hypothetical protein DL765_008429 [Monosporascus sp. GIB2]|nr:hypothetical protein DL765_008429 [Monosporascus sp. GIB2]
METQQVGTSIRLPWEKPNAPRTARRPGMGSRQTSLARTLHAGRARFLNSPPLPYVSVPKCPNLEPTVLSEFAGTFMFLLFAFSSTNTVNSAPLEGRSEKLAANPSQLVFICLCFGMSLAVNAWTFFRISGGLFNPAVSIGMMVVGASRSAPFCVDKPGTIRSVQGVYYTGGSLNPARSFGPCVVTGRFDGYHWIYWVGPILGALVASGFYVLIKTLEYETMNPEQDYDTPTKKTPMVNDSGGLVTPGEPRPHDAPEQEPYARDPELEADRSNA